MNLLNTWWWLLPLASGLMLALVSGPLGSFVVWRRMAFFGDTLAHGALLGITLGVISDLNPTLALLLSSIALGLLLYPLQQRSSLSSDTLLGIISHSMLAFGLVALSLARNVRVDLMGYLFGDLLAVGIEDLLWVSLAALVCGVLLIWQWRGLLATTVSQELASIDGYPVARLNLLLILMLALIIARRSADQRPADYSTGRCPQPRPYAGTYGHGRQRGGDVVGVIGADGVLAMGYSGRAQCCRGCGTVVCCQPGYSQTLIVQEAASAMPVQPCLPESPGLHEQHHAS
jgi:hypothetical protein